MTGKTIRIGSCCGSRRLYAPSADAIFRCYPTPMEWREFIPVLLTAALAVFILFVIFRSRT
jgi:hypothetical protein